MDIKPLSEEITSILRSGFAINSIPHCINEMVLNSLDANSSDVAVRVNLKTLRFQVVDNGEGITCTNLKLIGGCHMTNKCCTLADFKKKIKFYGFKGESLAYIKNSSSKVIIMTRCSSDSRTYCKTLEGSKETDISIIKNRPSVGTTVTVEDFLCNLPVRQKIVNNDLDLINIKQNLECLSIIRPMVSFTLRNDINKMMIYKSIKVNTVEEAIIKIHPQIDPSMLRHLKVERHKTSVTCLIYKKMLNTKIQFMYVNKRPIECPQLQKLIHEYLTNSLIYKTKKKNENKFLYVANINCPNSSIHITANSTKYLVEFKNWDLVNNCTEKILKKILTKESLYIEPVHKTINPTHYTLADKLNLSGMDGVSKCKAKKRKTNIPDCTGINDEIEIFLPEMLINVGTSTEIASSKRSWKYKNPKTQTLGTKQRYNSEICSNKNSMKSKSDFKAKQKISSKHLKQKYFMKDVLTTAMKINKRSFENIFAKERKRNNIDLKISNDDRLHVNLNVNQPFERKSILFEETDAISICKNMSLSYEENRDNINDVPNTTSQRQAISSESEKINQLSNVNSQVIGKALIMDKFLKSIITCDLENISDRDFRKNTVSFSVKFKSQKTVNRLKNKKRQNAFSNVSFAQIISIKNTAVSDYKYSSNYANVFEKQYDTFSKIIIDENAETNVFENDNRNFILEDGFQNTSVIFGIEDLNVKENVVNQKFNFHRTNSYHDFTMIFNKESDNRNLPIDFKDLQQPCNSNFRNNNIYCEKNGSKGNLNNRHLGLRYFSCKKPYIISNSRSTNCFAKPQNNEQTSFLHNLYNNKFNSHVKNSKNVFLYTNTRQIPTFECSTTYDYQTHISSQIHKLSNYTWLHDHDIKNHLSKKKPTIDQHFLKYENTQEENSWPYNPILGKYINECDITSTKSALSQIYKPVCGMLQHNTPDIYFTRHNDGKKKFSSNNKCTRDVEKGTLNNFKTNHHQSQHHSIKHVVFDRNVKHLINTQFKQNRFTNSDERSHVKQDDAYSIYKNAVSDMNEHLDGYLNINCDMFRVKHIRDRSKYLMRNGNLKVHPRGHYDFIKNKNKQQHSNSYKTSKGNPAIFYDRIKHQDKSHKPAIFATCDKFNDNSNIYYDRLLVDPDTLSQNCRIVPHIIEEFDSEEKHNEILASYKPNIFRPYLTYEFKEYKKCISNNSNKMIVDTENFKKLKIPHLSNKEVNNCNLKEKNYNGENYKMPKKSHLLKGNNYNFRENLKDLQNISKPKEIHIKNKYDRIVNNFISSSKRKRTIKHTKKVKKMNAFNIKEAQNTKITATGKSLRLNDVKNLSKKSRSTRNITTQTGKSLEIPNQDLIFGKQNENFRPVVNILNDIMICPPKNNECKPIPLIDINTGQSNVGDETHSKPGRQSNYNKNKNNLVPQFDLIDHQHEIESNMFPNVDVVDYLHVGNGDDEEPKVDLSLNILEAPNLKKISRELISKYKPSSKLRKLTYETTNNGLDIYEVVPDDIKTNENLEVVATNVITDPEVTNYFKPQITRRNVRTDRSKRMLSVKREHSGNYTKIKCFPILTTNIVSEMSIHSLDQINKPNNTVAQNLPENVEIKHVENIIRANQKNTSSLHQNLTTILDDSICNIFNIKHTNESNSNIFDYKMEKDTVQILPPQVETESSDLVVTLSDKEKNQLLQNEYIVPTFVVSSQFFKNSEQELPAKIEEPSGAYIGNRTGITLLPNIKQNGKFCFKSRSENLPKGFSPILMINEPSHVSLTSSGKVKLYQVLVETYEKELGVIKWKNIVNAKDLAGFLNCMYKQLKMSSIEVPIVSKYGRSIARPCNSSNPIVFNKHTFDNLCIIGQLDKKFILTLAENKTLVLLFDQHAVHERIRVESLYKDYTYQDHSNKDILKFRSTKLNKTIQIDLNQQDINLMKKYKTVFENVGLMYQNYSSLLDIKAAPNCLMNKAKKEGNTDKLKELLLALIEELLDSIQDTKGIVCNTPKLIQTVINSEACRGSIMFGEKLEILKCNMLIKELSSCNLSFQCAHGRPTLAPIIRLKNIRNQDLKVDLKKLWN